jgi:hypothetical protein
MAKKLVKLLLLLLAVGALLGLTSYVGARATAGKLVGSDPPLTKRSITFAYQGVPDLPGRPRAWVIHYDRTRLPGIRRATIYVSPTGALITTKPKDLATRIEAYRRSLEPGP